MLKNKDTLGLPSFIQEFYNDLVKGDATGWWNERYARRGELIGLNVNDAYLNSVYDLVEYVRENFESITQENIDSIKSHIQQVYMVLNYKRAYLWEVKTEEIESEVIVDDDVLPPTSDDKVPDFELCKTFKPDRKKLKEYAKQMGFEIDSRKKFDLMLKSFQGKYYANKAKNTEVVNGD